MADNLSNKIKGLYINSTKVKDLVLNGVSIFNEEGLPPGKELVIDRHTVNKLMICGLEAYSVAFRQKWIDENPANSQIGKIPNDSVGADFSFATVSRVKTFSYTSNKESPDTVGADIGFANATLQTTFEFTRSEAEEVGADLGFVNATVTSVNL